MSFQVLAAGGAVLLLLALVWLRGGAEMRRAAAILAVVTLAVATTTVILAGRPGEVGRPGDQDGSTPRDSPVQSTATPAPSGAASPTVSAGSANPSPSPTVLRHEVVVQAAQYTIFSVDEQGTVTAQRMATFDHTSTAPADRVQAPNGLIHWRATVGGYASWSYIAGRSGAFVVREVLRWPDGSTGYREVDPGS